MRDELSAFENLKNPNAWTGHFRGSPSAWSVADGDAVLRRLQEAESSPIARPLPKRRRSKYTKVAPPSDPPAADDLADEDIVGEERPKPSGTPERVHTEIQALLMRLGHDLGYPVYCARNDRSAEWEGKRLEDLPGSIGRLPAHIGLDPETSRETVQFIDVLWLDKGKKSVIAAFEVESTTSIYSGILRMSDLLAQYPNLSIPLFVAAPESRRSNVIGEVQRPTFQSLRPPLAEVVRYISFENLREEVTANAELLPFMRIEWLQSISEPCGEEDE
jgi:hypothetical protein